MPWKDGYHRRYTYRSTTPLFMPLYRLCGIIAQFCNSEFCHKIKFPRDIHTYSSLKTLRLNNVAKEFKNRCYSNLRQILIVLASYEYCHRSSTHLFMKSNKNYALNLDMHKRCVKIQDAINQRLLEVFFGLKPRKSKIKKNSIRAQLLMF